MNRIISFSFLFLFFLSNAQSRISTEEYIKLFSNIAISEMKRSGIPASITLAQGILESGSGNSKLATRANNHFGIKCHGWKGKKIYHDDDKRNECFRKYKNAEESYKDHTDFLVNASRYAFLFDLKPDDYKRWARGLKKAGYATSPTYATALIRIIEEYDLHEYDKDYSPEKKRGRKMNRFAPDDEDFSVSIGNRILENNRVDYIISKEGDTFKELQEEHDLLPWELYKYNDLENDASIHAGQILYLQPKRNRAEFGNDYHIVKQGETMYSVSQKYAVKLKKLYKKNLMEMGEEAEVGQKLWLRKKKKIN